MSRNSAQIKQLTMKIEQHPTKYGAWEAAVELAGIEDPEVVDLAALGLRAADPFSRECYLEVLARKKDAETIAELASVFQLSGLPRTGAVESISRLVKRSSLPQEFYDGVDRYTAQRKKTLHDPLELVCAIPNIIFPEENSGYAADLIGRILGTREFFSTLSKEQLGILHAMFYPDFENPKHREYREVRMWDCGEGSSLVEPYGQPFVGPGSLNYVMDSYLDKMRNHGKYASIADHPLKFIGEAFFHQNIIHPYYDCNGRTNFLLMNLFFLDHGLGYITMTYDHLPEYYRALNMSEPTGFVQFLGKLLTEEKAL